MRSAGYAGPARLVGSPPPPGTGRQLSPADVEALAFRTYRWRVHLDDVEPYRNDVEPYRITGQRAAAVLGVTCQVSPSWRASGSSHSRSTPTERDCTDASSSRSGPRSLALTAWVEP